MTSTGFHDYPSTLRLATGPVFHYTSAAGLVGMADYHGLWASEAAGLNDVAEVRQGWDFIQQWIDAQSPSEAVDFMRGLAADPLNGTHEVFVLCASTDGDDANQWRLYADGGTGYSVELDPASDLAVLPATVPTSTGKGPFATVGELASISPWLHVLYDPADVERALEEIHNKVIADLAAFASTTYDEEAAEVEGERMQTDTYEALATVAHLVKSSGFRGENEVRKVATLLWSKGNVRYRAGAYGVVGYVVLAQCPLTHTPRRVMKTTSAPDRLPIKSVRLGPLLRPENVSSVKALMRDRGYGFDVRESEVPLR